MIELYLDVDGVVLDFESSFVDFVRDEFIPDLPPDYILQTWEMSDEFKDLDIERVWKQFVNSDRFRRMKLLVDGESFNQLSRQYPLYLVTNIPNQQFQSRSENLAFHGLEYSGLFLAGHFNFGDDSYPTKSQVIQRLHQPGNRLIFLDDHPKNCDDIKQHFPESHVYLMERPHNKAVEDREWVRIRNWGEFNKRIISSIATGP